MSAGLKIFLGAVSLTVTAILIGLSFKLLARTENMSNSVIEEQDRVIQSEKEYNVVKYDGYEISGSVAINYIKTVVSDYEITVVIVKGTDSVTVSEAEQFAELRRIDSGYYLNPLKEYACKVSRDVNEEISSVSLTEIP